MRKLGFKDTENPSPVGSDQIGPRGRIGLGAECDEYIRIFEYSNILVTNIYSDIRSYQFFFYEYIRTFVRVKFVCTNIFGHSLVSVLECKT